MIRGTTPTFTFRLPFEVTDIDKVSVAFSQKRDLVLEKTKEDCSFVEDRIVVPLSQEDTLRFKGDSATEVQIRVKMTSGKAFASRIVTISTKRILKDGVL